MLTIYRGKAKNLPIKLLEKCGDMSLKEYLRLKQLKESAKCQSDVPT